MLLFRYSRFRYSLFPSRPPNEDLMNRHPWFLRLAASWSDGIRLCVAEGPASGRMMGYAYRNQANGRGILGRWIDRQFLHYPGWEGVRRRRACLERLISQAIDSLHADGREPVHLVDIAGGTADYVLGALEQTRTKAVTALCLDIANPSVEEGQRRAQAAGLANVRFQIGDAMNRGFAPRTDPQARRGDLQRLLRTADRG